MAFALTRISFLLLFSVINISCEAQRVVTAPGTCIRDEDCFQASEFCDENFQCRRRLHENAGCTVDQYCYEGLYCGLKDGRHACLPQKKPFEACEISVDTQTPCASTANMTYKCSEDTHTCQPTGIPGDYCSLEDDCQPGNYCPIYLFRPLGAITCTAQRPLGAACGLIGDPFECKEQCSYRGFPEIAAGMCISLSRIGRPCTENDQCEGHDASFHDPTKRAKSNVICNVAQDGIGVCQYERHLIKKDGARCNPQKDFCDSGRGLSCRRTATGPRCMFNRFDGDGPDIAFCDLNSKFSRCNSQSGYETECRANLDQSAYGLSKQFFQCLRRKEILPQGWLCNEYEHTVCEKGTSCEAVPGVEQEMFPLSRTAKFCVAVREEGESCFSKFGFACEKGLKCKNNICVKGKPDSTITHAYLNRYCDSLPCVPGTHCEPVDKLYPENTICTLKTVSKVEGEPCASTALNNVVR